MFVAKILAVAGAGFSDHKTVLPGEFNIKD
jgi:hypothetical protein